MKLADFILAIFLTSSIVAVLFIYQNSPPVERRPYICRQGWNQTSVECNALGSCSSESTCSISSLLVGLMQLLYLLFFAHTTRYGLRLFGVVLSGFFITAALSILFSNHFSGDIQSSSFFCSFIIPCNPNPTLKELCTKASKERIKIFTFNCTTSPDGWDIPAGSSSFPCIYSLITYAITAAGFGEWMIQKKITGAADNLWLVLTFVACGLYAYGFFCFIDLFATALELGTLLLENLSRLSPSPVYRIGRVNWFE